MNEQMVEMDQAAETAVTELEAAMAADPEVKKAVQVVGQWMAKHYMKAGYKRLSKALVILAK